MKLLGSYKNGNVSTMIFSDGTKVRQTKDDEFVPAYAENMDIKICDFCDLNCKFCHEGSSVNGKFGDILNEKFIDTLHPYQEVAIGGGDATAHPDLIPFLEKLKQKKVIANMTVNQVHFEEKQELIKELVDKKFIYGLGVSLVNPSEKFLSLVSQYPNAVIHVINGIWNADSLEKMRKYPNLKILILGYKELRRGKEYLSKGKLEVLCQKEWLYQNLEIILKGNDGKTPIFNAVSFDNLAIEQLNVRRFFSDKEWERFYMGDDGTMTFYIDMVKRQFAKSSTAPLDKRYPLLNGVDDMFSIIQKEQ